MLIQSGNAGTTYTGTDTTVGQMTAARFAPDSSYNTVVRTWTAGIGDMAGFSGTDKFGATINDNDLVLRADIRTASDVTGDRSSGQGMAFDVAANYGGIVPNLVVLNQAVQNLNTVDGVRRAADQLRPEVSGATDQAVLNAVAGTIGTIESRTQSLRLGSLGLSGVAAGEGEAERGVGLWLQGFGTSGSQSERDGFNGFDVRTGGAAVGADVAVADGLRLGVALSYAHGSIDEGGHRSGSGQSVDSYMAAFYGSYSHQHFYVDATVTAGRHYYDQTRDISIDTFTGTASADYEAEQFGGKIEAGVPLAVTENIYVTPMANLSHSWMKIDGYTETGAAGANLQVDGRDVSSTRVGIGTAFAANLGTPGGIGIIPTARILYTHEFGSRDYNTTARFAEGTQSFTVGGASPERDALHLGVGVDVAAASGVTVTAAYDAELRKGYTGHSGLVRVRLDF